MDFCFCTISIGYNHYQITFRNHIGYRSKGDGHYTKKKKKKEREKKRIDTLT